ncbi:unnamed protein product, partial [Urochloa humidicola]
PLDALASPALVTLLAQAAAGAGALDPDRGEADPTVADVMARYPPPSPHRRPSLVLLQPPPPLPPPPPPASRALPHRRLIPLTASLGQTETKGGGYCSLAAWVLWHGLLRWGTAAAVDKGIAPAAISPEVRTILLNDDNCACIS